MSVISADNHKKWFQQIWSGITGSSTRSHPAPYPVELAERLIRMFSFADDTVLDPFWGTGTTTVAAARSGRHSVGVEIDGMYFDSACKRVSAEASSLFGNRTINIHKAEL
jgi:DNA modification methylase